MALRLAHGARALASLWLLLAAPALHAEGPDLLLAGGHFALLRHALAPGTGDPSSFTLRDCQTQRNLSDAGRAQARRIGERLRASGVDDAHVVSSQWCRCLETARLLDLGEVEELPALNSFYEHPERRDPQLRDLRGWLASRALDQPLVLVTHQVTITALTGIYPRSGELVIVRRGADGELSVAATVETD